MSITLKQATDSFLLSKKAAGRSLRTIAKYQDTLRILARYTNGKCLEDITADDIRRYLADCREAGQKRTSQDTYYRTFSTFFTWCVAEYGISSPMERVERIHLPKRLPPYLSDEAICKLLVATSGSRHPLRDRAIVAVLVDTGIRAGELLGLTLKNIDFGAGELRVFGKDMEERLVPIDEQASKALTEHLKSRRDRDGNRPVFISQRTKEVLTVSGLRQVLKRLAQRAGVKERVYTHLFRHIFGRCWMRDGGDLESLGEVFGHNQLSTTRLYARQQIEDIKRKHRRISPANRLLRAAQLSLW